MLVIYEDNNNFILHWKGDTAARLHSLKHKCNHVTAQLKITNLSICILHSCSSSSHNDFLSVPVVLFKLSPAAWLLNRLAKVILHHAGLCLLIETFFGYIIQKCFPRSHTSPMAITLYLITSVFNGALNIVCYYFSWLYLSISGI